jgi:predicted adenine nucleotide alpha hydrolase (AANH) superfamily ATPase
MIEKQCTEQSDMNTYEKRNWKQISAKMLDSFGEISPQSLQALQSQQFQRPRLTLHSCCAPCSSYSLLYLTQFFDIDLYYYNPNISPESEYMHRLSEQKRLLDEMPLSGKVTLFEGVYDPDRWEELTAGLENEPERGRRCELCIRMRLKETAKLAARTNADCFSTTLTVSPHKNADMINYICLELEASTGAKALPLDLKKNNGYKRSIELSKQYNLYRQPFCGCRFSEKSRPEKT